MSVYYIHAPSAGLTKIGFSEKPLIRFNAVRSASLVPVVLLALETGGRAEEAARHAQFAKLRQRGEWFRHGPELADHIASLPPVPVKPESEYKANRKAHCLTQAEIAAKIGVNQATISRWESGDLVPNSRDLIAINTAIDELLAEKAKGIAA